MLLQLFSFTVSAENIQIDNSEQIATENNQPGIAIASSSWPWATTNKATKIKHGAITKSRLSDDGTCFVDKQVLAHIFTIKPSLQSKISAVMYFEVTDSGVMEFVSAIH